MTNPAAEPWCFQMVLSPNVELYAYALARGLLDRLNEAPPGFVERTNRCTVDGLSRPTDLGEDDCWLDYELTDADRHFLNPPRYETVA